eukprot:3481268-Amphidinium_carterae.1
MLGLSGSYLGQRLFAVESFMKRAPAQIEDKTLKLFEDQILGPYPQIVNPKASGVDLKSP